MSDPHFNIFYSYDRGSQKDADRISQLEDNATRGFLIVLKHLSDTDRKEFLCNLLTGTGIKKSQLSNLLFDLQNIDDRNDLNNIQKGQDVKKILLTISRESFDVDEMKQQIVNVVKNQTIKELLSANDDDEKTQKSIIVKKLKSELIRLKNDEDECGTIKELGNKKFKRKELSSIIAALGECRADGWIYNDKIAILVESKIGSNEVTEYQLYRHIKGKNGFKLPGIQTDNGFLLKCITWEDVAFCFSKYVSQISENESDNFVEKLISDRLSEKLMTEFKEYLTMTNQIFNPYENRDNRKSRNEQLSILVKKIEKAIENNNVLSQYKDFLKLDRKYSGGYIGKQIGKIKYAHYNINFDTPEFIGANLTLFGPPLTEERISILKQFIQKKIDIEIPSGYTVSKQQSELMRYGISAVGYRKVKKTERRGEGIETAKLAVNLFELVFNRKKQRKFLINNIFQFYEGNKLLFRQIDITYSIKFFQWNRKNYDESDIRYLNWELVKTPKKIVSAFIDFIQDTIEIAELFGLKG